MKGWTGLFLIEWINVEVKFSPWCPRVFVVFDKTDTHYFVFGAPYYPMQFLPWKDKISKSSMLVWGFEFSRTVFQKLRYYLTIKIPGKKYIKSVLNMNMLHKTPKQSKRVGLVLVYMFQTYLQSKHLNINVCLFFFRTSCVDESLTVRPETSLTSTSNRAHFYHF